MNIKCVKSCNGVGYEKFKKGEVRNIPKSIAEKLIKFGYGESAGGKDTDTQTTKGGKNKGDNNDNSEGKDEGGANEGDKE